MDIGYKIKSFKTLSHKARSRRETGAPKQASKTEKIILLDKIIIKEFSPIFSFGDNQANVGMLEKLMLHSFNELFQKHTNFQKKQHNSASRLNARSLVELYGLSTRGQSRR